MAMSRGAKVGLAIGVLGMLTGVAVPATVLWYVFAPAAPREPLTVRLDTQGPYVILATTKAAKSYAAAIEKAKALHPGAGREDFDPADLAVVQKALRKRQPRYALVFIEPGELDVNFGWAWLAMTAALDDDPFVDVRTGFITGATPAAAEAFVDRIAAAAAGKVQLPGAFVDNLGPPEQDTAVYFNSFGHSHMAPALKGRFTPRTVAHSKGNFTDDRLGSMDGAGLVHFGGHGHPDRIDDGLTAAQLPKLKLAPCVVFNGACYTGVTHRWFEQMGPRVVEHTVAADDCFCLNLLRGEAVTYLAALHPDHGMPVYQEMEYLACHGAPLGDVMKYTYDGVVLGNGGTMPKFGPLEDRADVPKWTPKDMMLKGTAARALFGDPALIVCDAFTPPAFKTTVTEEAGKLLVKATLTNAELKSTFTDTYTNDLNPQAPFNDRALVTVDLPAGWDAVGKVEAIEIRAGGQALTHRLVGHAVELDQGRRRLHVQVDVPAQGFQQSALRTAGATVALAVGRKE